MAGVQQLFSLFTGAALTAMIDLGFRNGTPSLPLSDPS